MRKPNTFLTSTFLLLASALFAQKNKEIPIQPVPDSTTFLQITQQIASGENALYVFDIDNTLLITNENKFGSDWWYEQTTTDPNLKLNVSASCLFDVLTPLFYASFNTTAVFGGQAQLVDGLATDSVSSRTIALTSRGYTPVIAASTELELTDNDFTFLQKDSAVLAPDVILLNGVIYTKGQNKGEILLNFVKNHNYTKIYYFDDSESKVKAVQKSFSGTGIDISIYHMLIAAKIPYTELEKAYMESKLCILIDAINQAGQTPCHCKNTSDENK